MASKIIKLEDFDLSKVKIHSLKEKEFKNKTISRSCAITWDNGEKIYLQFSKQKAPFGASLGKSYDGKTSTKWSMAINPSPVEEAKLISFDEMLIQFISQNSELWWKKKMSVDAVDGLGYGPIIKKNDSTKGDYPDRLNIKLPTFENKANFKVYDINNKPIILNTPMGINWDWSKQNMLVEGIVEIECLWVVGTKGYCTLKALQLRIEDPESLPDCAFGEISETVENDEEEGVEVEKLADEVEDLQVEEEVPKKGKKGKKET